MEDEEVEKRIREIQCEKDSSHLSDIENGGSRPQAKSCRWLQKERQGVGFPPSISRITGLLTLWFSFSFFFFHFSFIFISWRLITLQYCIGFLPYIDMNQPWIYMCSPFPSTLLPPSPSLPSGSSQCTSPKHLSHASNLSWWSVSPLVVYLFQCYSLTPPSPSPTESNCKTEKETQIYRTDFWTLWF